MDQVQTGRLIRALRQRQNMTQLMLAQKPNVSDKAVSKWERGCGAPDISLLARLADALGVDMEALLKGNLEENAMTNGNMKKMKFYVCSECGNLMFASEHADICCCGHKAAPLTAQKADREHELTVTKDDGEWYVTSAHEMRREHYLSFLAFLTEDTLIVKKQYPEWNLETRLPFFARAVLFWYCTKDGLFYRVVGE